MKVQRMLAGRQIVNAGAPLHPSAGRPQRGGSYTLALSILQFDHGFRRTRE